MAAPPEPEDTARDLIDTIRYMVLGTADPDGRPHVSPVYFAPAGYHLLYWISSPDARHSRNLADRPEVSIVVFDSTVLVGAADAVYITARAEEVPLDQLDACVEVACRARFPEMEVFPAAELRPPATLRLYRARVSEHSVLIRGGDPVRGRGVDYRLPVSL
jgi:hypothetical protein